MDVNQYVELIKCIKINDEIVTAVEEIFGVSLNDELKRIVSIVLDDYFIGKNCRVISVKEMLNTEEYTGVDFTDINMIPLADCCDADYIVYNFGTQKYEMYNIFDEVSFREADNLKEMLETLA